MEVFEGKEFVRLKSLVHGKYIHAADDGCSVRLDARRKVHNSVWAVQRPPPAGDGEVPVAPYFLLRGAYGRYLGAPDGLPPRKVSAAQRDFHVPAIEAIRWQAVAAGQGLVLLHDASGRYLQAKSRRLPCCTRVCVSISASPCKGREWEVETVFRSSAPPERTDLPMEPDEICLLVSRLCVRPPLSRLFQLWLERDIKWARADANSGNVEGNEEEWPSFVYSGRKAYVLQRKLMKLLPAGIDHNLTMCIRAGRHGQPSPLMIDLPHSREPLHIVLVMRGTPAAARLVIPDLHARIAVSTDERAALLN